MPILVKMTVFISVLVSAFTTLAIEWIAKPSLEARKERILEEHRKSREALWLCRAMLLRLGMLRSERSEHAEVVQLVLEARKELGELAKSLCDVLPYVVLQLPPHAARFAMHTGGLVRGATMDLRKAEPEVASCCLESLETLTWLLETHRGWRSAIGRRLAQKKALELLPARGDE